MNSKQVLECLLNIRLKFLSFLIIYFLYLESNLRTIAPRYSTVSCHRNPGTTHTKCCYINVQGDESKARRLNSDILCPNSKFRFTDCTLFTVVMVTNVFKIEYY